MASHSRSRWDNEEEDAALDAQRKKEKEAKKKAKEERQRKLERDARDRAVRASAEADQANGSDNINGGDPDRPSKRRRISREREDDGVVRSAGSQQPAPETTVLRFPAPEWGPCRHVDNFEKMNHIEEGSYGWVSRAKETATGEIVALKKLKMDNLNDGFPVTGLREIQTLMASRHGNIVKLREVVMGDKLEDVFLVMDFLEHDLKTLQEEMLEPFLPSETKTLLQQLASAVEYLHAHWIMHRDLKTSNLLMNNRGQIKVADFGMARYYGDPPPPKLTQLVVTLWYRAPELLLGAETYGAAIDLWSVGCIFGELLTKEPLFQGKNEVDQLAKIFNLTTPPTSKTWPGFSSLPHARSLRLPSNPASNAASSSSAAANNIRAAFPLLTTTGSALLTSLLSLDPSARPTATEVLAHAYFKEDPRPKSELLFPTFPSKAGMEKRRRGWSPSAPRRGEAPRLDGAGLGGIFGAGADEEEVGGGFRLRLV